MRWGCLLLVSMPLVSMLGCGDDDGANPDAGDDAGTGSDVGPMDAGTDAIEMDAGGDAATGDDAAMDAGTDAGTDAGPTMGTCGWNAADAELACFATDEIPDGLCAGDQCCTGTMCGPGMAIRCCNLVTGELRTVFYSGGTCETETDPCVD